MKSFVYHIQINVSSPSISFPFYKELLGLFSYKVTYEGKTALGLSNGTTDFWLVRTTKAYLPNNFHRKNVGLNHVAIGVESRENVNRFVNDFLKPRKIKPLYGSPKEFPEYQKGYYAVYFEDPDRMKIEIVYNPGSFEKRI